MGGVSGFAFTPHKLSICILLQAYALPTNSSPPFSLLSSPVRHRLALLLLQLLKAHDKFVEPTFEELEHQLKLALEEAGNLLVNQVANRLIAFSSPEDLFTFVLGLRELLAPVLNGASEPQTGEEEALLIDSSSALGQFVRRCVLAFSLLSFEGTCKLLADLDAYRQPMLTISETEIMIENLSSKKMEDAEDHDEDKLNEDDYYFEYGNIKPDSTLFGRDKMKKDSSEQVCSPVGSPIASEGGLSLGASVFDGRVQDGGLTLGFGDISSRVETLNEGTFLHTSGQVEAYMREQADLIEREVSSFSFGEVDTKLTQLEKLSPDSYKVHYLRYLNCLSSGDFPAAMDSLHRYFDYSAGKGGLNAGGTSSSATTGRFQAGLLALGSMHARFGHTNQALQALNEAVGIAQQNNDDMCLAHALAALCHVISEVGVPDARSLSGTSLPGLDIGNGPSLNVQQQLLLLLKCCLRRAVELRLPNLVAFSRLVLAKFNLKYVRRSPLLSGLKTSVQLGTSPLDVCKMLKLSPYLIDGTVSNSVPVITGTGTNLGVGNAQRPNATISSSANSQALNMSGSMVTAGGWSFQPGKLGSSLGSLFQLAGTSHLLRAASWELYGSAPMVRVSALIHASCYGDVASADDLSLAYVKLAQHLCTFKGYDEALDALDMAAKMFPLLAKSRLKAVRLQVIHERALHRGEIKLAQAACSMLAALASPVPGIDTELKMDATHRHARTLLAAGQFNEAASVARTLFDMCYKANMQLDSVMALLLMADIHKKAESIISGLPYALASLTLSQCFNLDLLHATAMVTVAELWLGLGSSHAERALRLLHQCMPMVLGHGGRELRGRTYLAVARCHLCNPSFSVQANPEAVLEPLQAAAEEFEILEDNEQASEAFYFQALVFNALHAEHDRGRAAALFKKHSLASYNAQMMETVSIPV